MKVESEGLILAAQDQGVLIRNYQPDIIKKG